ncbi:MAG: hypothetical protein OXI43_00610 [Candidatus Poribacteria bacterium]|nr:hypothetical protein [Candidatus Poribacteria bacterium]
MRRFFFFWSLMATTLIYTSLASAVTTSLWEQDQRAHFEAGEIKDISVTSKGDASLSFKIDDFSKIDAARVWAIAEDSEGNIYVGTGNEGKIYKISADDKTSTLYYDSPEVEIYSLVIAPDDTLYAGTGPDGLIYKITDQNTPPQTILSKGDKYVWAMHLDEAGNLYAVTGTEGKVYKITPEGESTVLFDAEEKNIRSLVAYEGGFYAGSSGNGIIYKITEDGTANVIYQAKEKEIRNLVMDSKGNVYVTAITSVPIDRSSSRPSRGPSVPAPQAPGSGPPRENKSYIYRLHPDGTTALVWSSPESLILATVLENDEQILVGTGSNGKLYRVYTETGDFEAIGKCSGKDILAIHQTKHGDSMKTILAAGNPGKLFTLTTARVEEGTLESSVHNAQSLSRWGKLSWEAQVEDGTSLTFATRSGNTRKPDDTWNKWSEELTIPEGSQIPNADGQYIQWRAKFTTTDPTKTPVLKKVTLASAQTNIEPRFTGISIGAAGRSSTQRPSSGPPPPSSSSRSSSASSSAKRWKIEWKVEDSNKDTLQFTVYYKAVDEENWKLLKKELSTPSYDWDITSIADGRYEVKVVATDKLSNPVGWEKSSEKTSMPVNVDNTDPDVGEILVKPNEDGTFNITCDVSDKMNIVQKAVYKIDNDEQWKVIFPEDGIFDSKEEQLLLKTGKLPEGAHSITIRVTDRAQNVATGRESF